MKEKILCLSAYVCLVLLLVLAPFVTSWAKDKETTNKPIELSFNHLFPEGSWMNTNAIIPWKKMVEEKSGGMVKINIFPSAALAKPGDMYDALKAGAIDICFDPGAYYWGRFPMSQFVQLPFLGARSARAANHTIMDLYYNFPRFKDEYSDIHILWLFCQGPGQLFTRKPIRTENDMKGLIMRAPGLQGKIMQALGASSVSMPAPECYLALSKGTIDGTSFPFEAVKVWRLPEVTKYATIFNGYLAWLWVGMNKEKYDSLPKKIKDVIDECSGYVGADLLGRAWDNADKAGFDYGKRMGMEINSLSPAELKRWEQSCSHITEEWIAEKEKKGYAARKLVEEAKRLYKKYNEKFGSWQD